MLTVSREGYFIMLTHTNLKVNLMPDYLTSCIGADGLFATAGGIALSDSLSRGSMIGVIELLNSMDAPGAAAVLQENGFLVSQISINQGLEAVIESVETDLILASQLRADGFHLHSGSLAVDKQNSDLQHIYLTDKSKLANVTMLFSDAKFSGDFEAAKAIQYLMGAPSINVELLGKIPASERGSLLFIANQALQKNVIGFGFEAVQGKFVVPLVMDEMIDLHRVSAAKVAQVAACEALGMWADGNAVGVVHEWIPDNIARIFHGATSLDSAQAAINIIEGNSITAHAGGIGAQKFSGLLHDLGYDINARTIAEQAEDLGLIIFDADKNRGQYLGSVVAVDFKACLIKCTHVKAFELPFDEIKDQPRPVYLDSVRIKYSDNNLALSIVNRDRESNFGRG